MQAFSCKVLLVLGAMVFGCGSDDSDPPPPPEVECGATSVPIYSEVRAFEVCTNCHSSQLSGPARNGAPTNVNFDSYEGAKANASRILTQVSSNSMPPPSSGFSLTAEEKQELYAWIECGTPE